MYELINVNNEILSFTNTDILINNLGGLGNPNITYQETKGFLANSVNVERFNLEPRQLTFELVTQLNRQTDLIDFWDLRSELLRFFNPYLAPFKLRITLPDGTQYELREIYPTNGLSYTNTPAFTSFAINEPISVTAKNPVFYNVVDVTEELAAGTTLAELGFAFPLVFDEEGNSYVYTINYTGTWKTYPIITIENQYDSAVINYNGASITLSTGITDGESRIIDLTENNLSIVNENGDNKWDELQVTDNLVDFVILPFTNETIEAVISNPSVNTTISIQYETTYIGI